MTSSAILLTSARAAMIGILGQFLLAGLSLFHDGELWAIHGILGGLIALPIAAAAVVVFRDSDRRDDRPAVLRLAAAYAVQLTLAGAGQASGVGAILALHVFNAAFVLGAAASLSERVSAGRSRRPDAAGEPEGAPERR